jgi:hypothetical protein
MRGYRIGLISVGLLFVIGLAAAPIATADSCDNAALRAQNGSAGLPDCRAYEMVSSPYKEGFPVMGPFRFTDEGTVSYRLRGAIAGNAHGTVGNSYHAERSATGWLTSPVDPSMEHFNTSYVGDFGQPMEAESADLRWSLWRMYRRDEPQTKIGYWLRGPDGAFTRIGDILRPGTYETKEQLIGGVVGARLVSSDDLSHVVLSAGFAGTATATALTEFVGTGHSWPPRPVSVNNVGQPTPGETCSRNISPDGRVIVFVSGCNGTGTLQVWARVAGSATVAVSGSECTRPFGHPDGPCNGVSAAEYEGGATDGSRVFFTTNQQLVNGDIDQTNDLYACDIPAGVPAPVGSANPCGALTEVSGTASGAQAQVESVSVVSDDGSRVYFVAQGVLADNLGANGAAPVAGQSNLYLWIKDAAHPAGEVRFVAKLDVGDVGGPQLTPDARYLVFTTAAALVTSGPGSDDDGGAKDVYRYDAGTHQIVRVSTSVAGGGNSGFDVSIPAASAMTSDGSTVIFNTAEALSASDTNGVTDVYAWHDGQVSLISPSPPSGAGSLGITPSGRDIFFGTSSPLLAADRDAIGDIYTARVGGGFALPRPPALCSGDGCQGLLSGAPGLAGPRSGLSGDSDPDDAATAFSLRAVTATQRRRLAATGKVSLTVAANAAGRVTATARAKIGGRSVTVASGRRTMTTPGSMAVALKLSRNARAQLAARGRLTVKVSVSHSKATRGRSVTLKLTRARAKKSSVRGRS